MSAQTTYHVFQPLTDGEFVITGDGNRVGVGIVQDGARASWVIQHDDVEAVCAALRQAAGLAAEVNA